MRLDRTLNRDEIQEVRDAFEAWQFPEDHFGQYSYGNQSWQASKTSHRNRIIHGAEVQTHAQKEG